MPNDEEVRLDILVRRLRRELRHMSENMHATEGEIDTIYRLLKNMDARLRANDGTYVGTNLESRVIAAMAISRTRHGMDE